MVVLTTKTLPLQKNGFNKNIIQNMMNIFLIRAEKYGRIRDMPPKSRVFFYVIPHL